MKIAFLGDIALFGKNTVNNTSYRQAFGPIKKILEHCDFVVGNLESPLTNQTKTIGGKSAYLKGTPNDVELLKYLHVTHVTLANNHMFDYRAQGLQDTIQILNQNGIKWFGINNKTATIVDDQSAVLLMGYCCYSTNGKGLGDKELYINVLDPRKIENDISQAIQNGMLPVISVHWGQEHVHYPNYDHVEVARKLCKERKIIIHGHHPHVIQGIEEIEESIIAYSLGNFCFDDVYTKKSKDPLIRLSKDNKESFILIVEIERNSIRNYEVVPFSFEENKYQIDDKIMTKLQDWSSFLNTSREIYINKRSKDLDVYLSNRRELRNLEWYVKRMNLESIKMFIASKKNLKKYNQLIKTYIL